MDLAVVVGTRPEIVKMAPVILALREADVPFSLIHTGQHYDQELSSVFLEELGLGPPDALLDVGSGSQAKQTAEALIQLEGHFLEHRPKLVLVEGDTNTVLAAALAAAKLGVDVGHVEAGLRSHDLRMPEEHNRRLTDHLSSYLYAPTDSAS
ncbi:MAG: UDP-N-acetylglucosamine 2-epimerase, partial [Thermoplasmata archaeon]|nr:UDP-N-acetylglucosamine 2-epimerase [Thermoplasmata archaeon]